MAIEGAGERRRKMKILSNGLNIHVEQQGAGDPALVFLHYYGGSSRTWKHVTARLAPRFRTVAIDHRGWGRSDAPETGYSLTDLAQDANGVIEALGLTHYVLIGHSMGGKMAQLMASSRPTGLAGLILVAPAPPSPMIMPAQAREKMAGAYATRQTVEDAIDNMLTAKPLGADDRAQVIEDSLRGSPAAKIAWPRATSLEDIAARVGDINVPTLIISGELDRVDPPSRLKIELLPRIPQATMAVVPGTGHLSMLESPDAVAALITAFCDDLDGSAAGSRRRD
jgi:pimeloyl-ACP methyl ester carboxylesterase